MCFSTTPIHCFLCHENCQEDHQCSVILICWHTYVKQWETEPVPDLLLCIITKANWIKIAKEADSLISWAELHILYCFLFALMNRFYLRVQNAGGVYADWSILHPQCDLFSLKVTFDQKVDLNYVSVSQNNQKVSPKKNYYYSGPDKSSGPWLLRNLAHTIISFIYFFSAHAWGWLPWLYDPVHAITLWRAPTIHQLSTHSN